MANDNDGLTWFLATALVLALILGLSEDAWRALRALWAGVTVLSLMALMEPLRRGLSKRGGGLPIPVFGALLMRGVLIGLLFASLSVALLVA